MKPRELSHFERRLINLMDFYSCGQLDANLFVRNYQTWCRKHFAENQVKGDPINQALFDLDIDLNFYQPKVKIREPNLFTFGDKGLQEKVDQIRSTLIERGYDTLY